MADLRIVIAVRQHHPQRAALQPLFPGRVVGHLGEIPDAHDAAPVRAIRGRITVCLYHCRPPKRGSRGNDTAPALDFRFRGNDASAIDHRHPPAITVNKSGEFFDKSLTAAPNPEMAGIGDQFDPDAGDSRSANSRRVSVARDHGAG